MRSADWLVDMGPGAGEHGGHVVAEGPAEKVASEPRLGDGAVPLRHACDRRPRAAHGRRRLVRRARGAAQHNLKGDRRRVPGREARLRRRACPAPGKSTLVNEIVYKALANRLNKLRVKPGEHAAVEGIEVFDKVIDIDQSPIGRTPRSNPATYTDLFTPIRELYSLTPGGEGARLQAGPVLVQRPRRPLRDLQGRRPDQDRDALPARRLRAVRDVQGRALQPRDARGALQGQEHRRGARHVGRGGARVLREDPEDPAEAADAPRRRARLHQARPAGDDALRRRGAAREAGEGAVEGRDRDGRSTSSTSRRPASTSPTSRSCSRCCSGWSTPGTPCS